MLGVRFLLCAIALIVAATREARAADAVPGTLEDITQAQADLVMGKLVEKGSLGKFLHRREPASIEGRTVRELNRDTLYSVAVFDLDAGPVTITLPDAGSRFMLLEIVDQYGFANAAYYGAGSYVVEPIEHGTLRTRYAVAAAHIFVDTADPKDVQQVHALQDAIQVCQESRSWFEWFAVPSWDPIGQDWVRQALPQLGSTHTRIEGSVSRNDGETIHRVVMKGVPVDSFWSVAVYDADGYFQRNEYDAYSLNSVSAWKNSDGSIPMQFGGCDGKLPNCLPTLPGWTYEIRLHGLRSSDLHADFYSGRWTLPEFQPAN